MDAKTKEQVELAERLQVKWLQRMEAMLDNGSITSTDMATLFRFLVHNGWTLDVSKLPTGLRDKLTQHVDPKSFDDDDADVVGRIA